MISTPTDYDAEKYIHTSPIEAVIRVEMFINLKVIIEIKLIVHIG